ncbi:MAG: hypothetical protein AAGF88_01350 [Pseudomonadota bacterium]
MSDHLPKGVVAGLPQLSGSERRAEVHRMTIHAGGQVYPVLRIFSHGFEVDKERTPRLRGLVDIYDGPQQLARALVVVTAESAEARRYEFKRTTPAVSDPPPVDFVR